MMSEKIMKKFQVWYFVILKSSAKRDFTKFIIFLREKTQYKKNKENVSLKKHQLINPLPENLIFSESPQFFKLDRFISTNLSA